MGLGKHLGADISNFFKFLIAESSGAETLPKASTHGTYLCAKFQFNSSPQSKDMKKLVPQSKISSLPRLFDFF